MGTTLTETLTTLVQAMPAPTLDAFEQALPELTQAVNRQLAQRADIADYIGPNSLSVMRQDNRNQGAFLLTHLKTRSIQTMLEGIVWAYRTYMNLGFSPIYFPVGLKAWQDAIAKQIAPDYASPLLALYQCLIDHHADFLVLSYTKQETVEIDETLLSFFRRYKEALLEPDIRKAVQVSKEYIRTVDDIPTWWERIILPALYEIGRLWAEGVITVGQEHIATSISQRVMSLYYPLILELPRDKGAVVVTVSPHELHEIGARMLADMLEMKGWDVYYTGANTPVESLIALLQQKGAHFLCISTTISANLTYVADIIQRVRDTAQHTDTPTHILVGGQAYMSDMELWKRVGADGFALSANRAADYLQTFVQTNGQSNGNGSNLQDEKGRNHESG